MTLGTERQTTAVLSENHGYVRSDSPLGWDENEKGQPTGDKEATMSFWQAIASGFRNYVAFSGRATRSEYWYWMLFTTLIGAATTNLDTANSVFSLITFLPSLAVGVRRLHDIDRTGWWWLLAFTIIGIFVLIFWFCERGTRGPNRYGPDLYKLEDNIKDGAVTAT